MQTILKFLETFEGLKKTATKIARNYCSNPEKELSNRWKVLKKCSDLEIGRCSDRTNFGLTRDDEFLYEAPCYLSKHETISVSSLLTSLKENKDFNLTDNEELIFKEYCLKNFYTKMIFDW